MNDPKLSFKAVRRNCLECAGDGARYVIWCPCDGVNSSRCEFWPFRFGVRPATFRGKHGDRLLTPEQMPPADIEVERLPSNLTDAATAEINVDGYHQAAVTVAPYKPKRNLTPEQRQAVVERLRRGREKQAAAGVA